MCFLEKRYVACAYVGHYVDGPNSYDRKACDEAKKQGEFSLCDEVHTKYEPAFISPFGEQCTQAEHSLQDHVRKALMESLSEGQLCRPVFTEPLLDKILESVETPERAHRTSLDELTSFLKVASGTQISTSHRSCASAWLDREIKLSVPRVDMTAMAELFAGWLTQALKAKLIDAAIAIAVDEKYETRLQLLQMLKKGTEVMMVYRARVECHGTWELFLLLSGIRKSPSSGSQSHGIDHSAGEKADRPVD